MARSSWKTIETTRDGACHLCEKELPTGTSVRWHPKHGLQCLGGCVNGPVGPTAEQLAETAKKVAERQHGPGRSGMREMNSKFRSKCRGCSETIEAGEPILWSKASGAFHVACFEDETGGVDPIQKAEAAAEEAFEQRLGLGETA